MNAQDTALSVAVGFIIVMVILLSTTFGLKRLQEPLSQSEQFDKAQFCVQTYRLPLVSETKVICRDIKGRDEEAP